MAGVGVGVGCFLEISASKVRLVLLWLSDSAE